MDCTRTPFVNRMCLCLLWTSSFSGGLCVSGSLLAQPPADRDWVSQADALLVEDALIVEKGQLFVDGQHISAPYELGIKNNRLVVNGVQLADNLTQRGTAIETTYGPTSQSERGGRRGRSDRWGTANDPARLESSRPRGGPGRRGNFMGRQRGLTGGGRNLPPPPYRGTNHSESPSREGKLLPSAQLGNLASALRSDAIVVSFSDTDTTILQNPSGKSIFCETLLTSTPSDEQRQEFFSLTATASRPHWEAMLEEFEASPELAEWMSETVAMHDEVEARNLRQIMASSVLDRAAYPLTVVGMLLGVFALGHTLRWSSANPTGEDAKRYAIIALGLILGMSALDLAWTAIAAAAGQMKELNPMALGLVNSPWALFGFKFSVTMMACGILLSLRSNSKAQFATWWMCLVCVLLTFRWVVFNSLLV